MLACPSIASRFAGSVNRTRSQGVDRARLSVKASAARIKPLDLTLVARDAARAAREVVLEAVDKPRNITNKSATDIVTDTDKAAEAAIVSVIQKAFPQHAILGEEGGVLGDVKSEYLWCLDPIDGTANFAQGYPGFCISIGVLRHALPVAACVIEFVGCPGQWSTMEYLAHRNGGATCNDRPLSVSRVKELGQALLVTEMSDREESWGVNVDLYRRLIKTTRGIRCSGSAALNLCRLASGAVDVYWQYFLKPWDVAAGVLILEEAGGMVTTCDGLPYSVFDRSLLATNDSLHSKMVRLTEVGHRHMLGEGVSLGPWCVPEGYGVKTGSQLE